MFSAVRWRERAARNGRASEPTRALHSSVRREKAQLSSRHPARSNMDLGFTRRSGTFLWLSLLLCCIGGTLSKESCDGSLVSHLPPSAFSSSSQLSSSHGPGFAKLNRRDGAGGWSPMESNKYQWLEINLGERTEITAIATQGRYGSSDWVTGYQLMFSDTGHNWRQYRQEDSIGVFSGNTNADGVVPFKLHQPMFARHLRVVPLDWNPNGRIGLRLEAYGCQYKSDVMQFDGSSSLVYKFSPNSSQPTKDKLSLKFKTLINSGNLLHMEAMHGQSLTVELLKGKLLFHLRKGKRPSPDFHASMSLGSLLDDQHWHSVTIERVSRHLNFTVDKSTQQLQVPGHLSLSDISEISFGGVSGPSASRTLSRKNFRGCMENVLYNDMNIVHLAQEGRHVSITGAVSFTCSEPVDVPVTFSSAGSFLQLPLSMPSDELSISLEFRTWNKAGLLLTFDLQQQAGSTWLYLSEAQVRLQIHKAGRVLVNIIAGSGLNDGQWHTVYLSGRRGRLSVTVDGEDGSTAQANPSFPVVPENQLYFGGCPEEEKLANHRCRNPFSVFQGCMRLIRTGDQEVDLIKVQQMSLGNFSDLQMDMCGIIDRCSISYCEHGGKCTQSWNTFHCNCSHTGYKGATCHSSIYEQSCEAYKHKGNTSEFYHIDVDGSGPINPQRIYCNMTDKTWMVIQHNNTELTKLKSSSGINQHLAYFNYPADAEQLRAIITKAEHCEQELSYHCKKSRLLNTPVGAPYTWWMDGAGEAQTYWGGASPGSQQCACGLRENCVNSEHSCNCDADGVDWANDTGRLSHKEHLPVRGIAVGDLSRPGSEAAYRVGALQCYGDLNFWNSAYFNKETSYLHFPTFHGELSADISFLFKTSAASGVFLENLGIKDFIRIELSSPIEVVFSYDVGNGPVEVRVESPTPLNDDRWHIVRAERNVKEASLHVDLLPGATRRAPPDGHLHLQLNSQLFVGGTASRQKGFLGCIRSLQLNGRTLDLEERAKITPGVRPGCPGHCSSYGDLCQNRGRCVERYTGFTCDCGLSAHTGAFCQKEVAAYFKSSTSVSYTFKEPYELNRNSSIQASSIYSDMTLRGENISLGFRTTQAPALLLYVGSYYREYLAVLLNRNGHLDVKYKLESNREVEVFKPSTRNLANGQLHTVSIRRQAENLYIQVDQNEQEDFNITSDVEFNAIKSVMLGKVHDSGELDPEIVRLNAVGFTGCLSVVQFNSIAPLKAALLYPATSPVVVTGPLKESTCGSSTPSHPHAPETTHSLTGVIGVVIFVILAALAVMGRCLYRRKETFQTQPPPKGGKTEDSPEFPFNNEANTQYVLRENQREHFI
ncbi:contactin-associated protein-like 4 isoform X2 [Clupea harengus]|uniref:Contactin-associated protein-like 4 isoform X2 n=1 Tax=Clupea harengus TaxID=7950 RepID=A0A6P8EVK0_CLUHA|nr:contactin-associated protein-like 4 isoform X2 [Clupea harengus]